METTTDVHSNRPSLINMLSAPWAMEPEDVAGRLGVTPSTGLSEDQVRQRREEYGTNRLRQHPRRGVLEILIDQLRSAIVVLLAVAGLLAVLFGEIVEAAAVGVVLLINTAIGFATERRAVRSMEALRDLGTVRTTVRRDGEIERIDAEDLVPGDWMLLEGGDVVTADARLVSASNLQVDESTLTGESLPVEKQTAAVAEDALLADRWSMVFKGTAISRGTGEAVVVGTGVETELGTIAELVAEAEESSTPLQIRLENLGRRLLWVTLGVAVVVGAIGWSAGRSPRLIVETAIALAVAAIPEGLPIVATIALARGMARMAKRNALVEKLEAVETLGSVGVILTDKTGTLTENRMTVDLVRLADRSMGITGGYGVSGHVEDDGEPVDLASSPAMRQLLKVAVLCNNADLGSGDEPVGDPMEVAMLMAAAKAGLDRSRLLDELPRVREEAFDPDLKMMATLHRSGDSLAVAVKGAPLEVIQRCVEVAEDSDTKRLDEVTRSWWLEQNELIAAEGLRVIALADGEVERAEADPFGSLR
ncbi:MAG: HAD-IC family P-type ATPase, partial [Acidimicrobiia bacterium]